MTCRLLLLRNDSLSWLSLFSGVTFLFCRIPCVECLMDPLSCKRNNNNNLKISTGKQDSRIYIDDTFTSVIILDWLQKSFSTY